MITQKENEPKPQIDRKVVEVYIKPEDMLDHNQRAAVLTRGLDDLLILPGDGSGITPSRSGGKIRPRDDVYDSSNDSSWKPD